MQDLTTIFGNCIIPKNTFLFRGHSDNSLNDSMFFATKHRIAGAFNDKIQVWKTTTEIQVLFLVEYLTDRSWTISALPRLYKTIFPQESNSNFDDLDIKHENLERRNKIARALFDNYKISGWLSSLENNMEIEICLFDKFANHNQIAQIDISDRANDFYFKDSLFNIEIFAPDIFYEKTLKKLNQQSPLLKGKSEHFRRYEKWMNELIDDDMQNGQDREKSRHYHNNLRMKLKI